MKYKHEQSGEIKTLEEWQNIFEDFGASGFSDFESFKSEWLTEDKIYTRKEIEDRGLTGVATSHVSEEIIWLDDSIEEGRTVFTIENGVFALCGDVVIESGEEKDGGDIVESIWYDEESVWEVELD